MAGPQIDPRLQFQMEAMQRETQKGYAIEAEPIGSFFRVRFFNDMESVMMLANREQLRQIHAEIGRALDLSKDRKARRRATRTPR